MSDYYKIIYSEDELKWFFDHCVPSLKKDEVFFCSLSARNKYLTEEERETLGLGRTEMMSKTIIRHDSWERFLEHIHRLECHKKGLLTKKVFQSPKSV